MVESDVACSECGGGFRRLEIESLSGTGGEYPCPTCAKVLKTFSGKDAFVAYRVTIQPSMKGIRQ
jgi:hypothetical protein